MRNFLAFWRGLVRIGVIQLKAGLGGMLPWELGLCAYIL